MSEFPIRYIYNKGQITPVNIIGDGLAVPVGTIVKIKPSDTIFDDKMDAMYRKLVDDLDGGKPLKNYRTSKYFGYYIERLRKEKPEHAL